MFCKSDSKKKNDNNANPNIPKEQSAWVVVKQGMPRQALEFKTDYAVPKLKNGHVLVRVKSAALNPVGWKVMKVLPTALSGRPHPAEHDLAGIIADPNGEKFTEGDEVIGWIPVPLQYRTSQGALAQYVSVPATNLILKPSNITWEEAAGLPLAAMTAVQGLRHGGYDVTKFLQSGSPPPEAEERDTVFINGGSTSVGIYAIQLAKYLGLKVVATASARNEALVRSLGADEFIDYTAAPLPDYLTANPPNPPFGMIFDAAGLLDPSLYARSEAYTKPKAVYMTVGPWPDEKGVLCMIGKLAGPVAMPGFLGGVKRPWKLSNVEADQDDLQALGTLIEKGALRLRVDSSFEFANTLDAYDRLMTGRATGKIVVKVDCS